MGGSANYEATGGELSTPEDLAGGKVWCFGGARAVIKEEEAIGLQIHKLGRSEQIGT